MHGFRICGFSDLKLSGTPPEGGTLGLTTPRGMLSPRVPPGWVRGKQGGGRCSSVGPLKTECPCKPKLDAGYPDVLSLALSSSQMC